jgi:hypothetical protein
MMDVQTPIALSMVAASAGTLVWRQLRGFRPAKTAKPAGPAGCNGCPSGGSCSKVSCG